MHRNFFQLVHTYQLLELAIAFDGMCIHHHNNNNNNSNILHDTYAQKGRKETIQLDTSRPPPLPSNNYKKCQNCLNDESQHDIIDDSNYKCRISVDFA